MEKRKSSIAKNHYEFGGCFRSKESFRKFVRIPVTKKISEVSCRQCLDRIKRKKLVDRSTFPEVPIFEAEGKVGSQAWFTCPVCGKRNTHGKGDGHVTSHCDCWEKGYFFKA